MACVRIDSIPAVQRSWHLLNHPIEPRADKDIVLAVRPGNIRLHSVVTKHAEGALGAAVVVRQDFHVPGFTDDTFTVKLTPKMVRQAAYIAERSPIVVFTVTDKQLTITGQGTHEHVEPSISTISPARPPWDDEVASAQYASSRIARALESFRSVMGIVPGDASGLALRVGGDHLTLTAGCSTRRATHTVSAQKGACETWEGLCPVYWVRPLADFLRHLPGEIELQTDANQLRLRGKDFQLTLSRNAPFSVVDIRPAPSSAIYRLTPPQGRQVYEAVHEISGSEANAIVEFSRQDEALKLKYVSSDTPTPAVVVTEVAVDQALGVCPPVSVPGEDFDRALQSARKLQPKGSNLYLHINDSKFLQLRLSDPRYLMELSQIRMAQFPLRDDLQVFAAISTNYRIVSRSNLNGFLLSFYHFPDRIKDHPEEFPEFLEKQGLLGLRLFCDCGAFTARAKGKSIDSDQYGCFIAATHQLFDKYTSMDLYYATVEENVVEYVKLWGLELDPIYVTHMGENVEALRQVFRGAHGFKPQNVGWGGAARDGAGVRIGYVQQMLSLIAPEDLPNMRTHGFGMLQETLIKRFPFTSVDASTWGIWAQHYQIPTPWGLMSLKKRPHNSVYNSPLLKEVEQWVKSLSYRQPVEVEFSLDTLVENLEMRQLFALSYYAYLGRYYRKMDHAVLHRRFYPVDELADMDEFIMPETRSVPQPAVEDMTPIKLITKHQNS